MKETKEQIEHLEAENKRLLSYIAACRIKFGDCAVNQAIHEFAPKPRPEPETCFPFNFGAELIAVFERIKKKPLAPQQP